MAERAANTVREDNGIQTITWTGLLDTDTGAAALIGPAEELSVQVTGVYNGATLAIEGSNDGVTWGALGSGIAITVGSAIVRIPERPKYIRPNAGAAGGATTDLDIFVVVVPSI